LPCSACSPTLMIDATCFLPKRRLTSKGLHRLYPPNTRLLVWYSLLSSGTWRRRTIIPTFRGNCLSFLFAAHMRIYHHDEKNRLRYLDNITVPSSWIAGCGFCVVICLCVRNGPFLVFYFLGVGWDWVHLGRRPLTGLLYQPRMIDDECGAVGGMRIDRGNRRTWRKPAPAPLFPLEIANDLSWARTRAAAVGSRLLTASAMARFLKSSYMTFFPNVGKYLPDYTGSQIRVVSDFYSP
jgi:hypothetical protein